MGKLITKTVHERRKTVFDAIKKSLLAGLGAAVVTKQMVQQAAHTFVDQGKISTEEAERLAEDLIRSGEHQWNDLQSRINESVRKGLDNLDINSRRELEELKDRLNALERRISLLEKIQTGAKGIK